ncbi:MAG: GNAT family N-acetyltransferase, partial [Anaerolineaceae bacterium]|nr:GNAT family N-acetyltransferase [Anaerolineaceae bacterium]
MIEIKNAPPIPGLHFRHYRGENDHFHIASVLSASESADQMERKVTADDIANAYQHLSNCDPYQDMIIAEVSGEMVGYARGWWKDESATERLYEHNSFILPEWRQKEINHTLLVWMENRLRDIAANHPSEITKYFHVNVSQFQKETSALLERSGYQPVRYFYEMVRPDLNSIVEFPLPDGVELRPVLPENYPVLWKSIDETSQDEWGY